MWNQKLGTHKLKCLTVDRATVHLFRDLGRHAHVVEKFCWSICTPGRLTSQMHQHCSHHYQCLFLLESLVGGVAFDFAPVVGCVHVPPDLCTRCLLPPPHPPMFQSLHWHWIRENHRTTCYRHYHRLASLVAARTLEIFRERFGWVWLTIVSVVFRKRCSWNDSLWWFWFCPRRRDISDGSTSSTWSILVRVSGMGEQWENLKFFLSLRWMSNLHRSTSLYCRPCMTGSCCNTKIVLRCCRNFRKSIADSWDELEKEFWATGRCKQSVELRRNLLLVEQSLVQLTKFSCLSNFLQLLQLYWTTGLSLPAATRFICRHESVCRRFLTASDGSNGILAFWNEFQFGITNARRETHWKFVSLLSLGLPHASQWPVVSLLFGMPFWASVVTFVDFVSVRSVGTAFWERNHFSSENQKQQTCIRTSVMI